MKTTLNSLLVGILVVFCCSIGSAQISYTNALSLDGATLIYSNLFNGAAVTVDGTAPTMANSVLGGTNSAIWNVVSNNAAAGAYLYQDGTVGLLGNSYLLPFAPQSNYVYVLTTSANLPAMTSGKWISWGFAQFATNKSTGARFADTAVNGYDFMIGTCGAGSEQYWGGPRATGYNSSAQLMPTAGNHVIQIILDTTRTKWTGTTNWVGAGFVDGRQVGTNYVFTSTPPIGAAGLGQTGLGSSAGIQYVYFTLSATPLVITKQPVSAAVAAGGAFTNTVVVSATAPFYQWFTNDVPIAGATNASLILNPVTAANAGTNYYVVVTNGLGGAATSAPVSLTVYAAPTIAATYPVAYTNPITLYGGTTVDGTNYPGSTPSFSVSVVGQTPLYYQWQTNGVAVGGATNASFIFTNCPLNGPTNFACVVTNSVGSASNAWLVSYLPAPMALFPSTILAYTPLGFWRLNEGPDDGNGDNGAIALDYASGNNGIYSNAVLANAGYTNVGSLLYNNTDPSDASVHFNFAGSHSEVFGIEGIDFSNSVSATFSVQAWVKGSPGQLNGACIIAKGYNGGEQFALDVNGNKYRFLVRNGAGTASSVTAGTGPDNTWHFIVGVCDEVKGSVSLYIDGLTVASTPIPSGSKVFPCATPISIGARGSSATDADSLQFDGYLSDVAAYNLAFTPGQVASLWMAAGGSVGFTFVPPLPPTNFVFQANGTIILPATVFGPPPMGYYWTNVTAGGIVGSGETNVLGNLNATLTISNTPASLSGDLLELVITNATDSTNWFTSLFSPPPPVTLDYSDPILYSNSFNGGMWSIGGTPVTAANGLVGGTNTTWTDALGTNDTGSMQANGVSATSAQDSWVLPFSPHAGYVYTLNASVTFRGDPGTWVGLGFAQTVPTNAAVGYGRFSDGGNTPPQQGPNGYDWLIARPSSASEQWFTGPGGTPAAGIASADVVNAIGTWALQLVLDTTGTNWVISCFINGTQFGTNYIYASNPPIGAVGITQNNLSAPGNVQWNYFSLAQVAPGGVPPYVQNPLPPTNVTVLPDASLSIPVTAFGSAPFGYYWSNTNTAAVLGSGTTDDMAPLSANLTIADVPSSWNGNTLSLTVTNAYGTNISLVSLTVSSTAIIPTNQPTITGFGLVGGTNVMIDATNGQAGGTYYLLGSTNLAMPLSQWLPLATNVIVTNGGLVNGFNFTGTNVVHVGDPQHFYILSNTN